MDTYIIRMQIYKINARFIQQICVRFVYVSEKLSVSFTAGFASDLFYFLIFLSPIRELFGKILGFRHGANFSYVMASVLPFSVIKHNCAR